MLERANFQSPKHTKTISTVFVISTSLSKIMLPTLRKWKKGREGKGREEW